MKNFILTLAFICLFSTIYAHTGEGQKLTHDALSKLNGSVAEGKAAIELLNEYLKVNQENDVDYLYNPDNGELVLYLNSGVEKVEVKSFHITSHVTNLDFMVNDKILLHVSYYKDSGKILLTRSMQYSEFWQESIPVITEL
ncbi:hypothetical protein KMW28_28330 [Flammeovirga yaeyamensis]|uniref:Nuclear transport factor 2 family protein n=1 Tax=Flammeovirga yaeyamensis TaxID=367791 RepID=A0AAX1NEJ1_9BACT|nr:hypothetical protein [Flammeovirga yaeyamensis]MBB3697276.1 saccharopine dehydrogenase-like NADP-dependent oxidoreductase [Flammeovirga yaeyamensis]NMF33933.1 hypothetical protein [Flammeovirga yaeyamensis]QWG04807.1 hypothetical protein KMW28_28330 [Flammeovirga yaeyamensis]